MTDNAGAVGLAEMLRKRCNQDFDGECHLTVAEAKQLIARLTNPAEPSEAMIDAGVRAHGGHKNIGEQVRAIYLSMERERLAMTKGGGNVG